MGRKLDLPEKNPRKLMGEREALTDGGWNLEEATGSEERENKTYFHSLVSFSV